MMAAVLFQDQRNRALLIRYRNGKIKPATRPWRQRNGPFVDRLGDPDLVNARRIADAEIQILAIKPDPQLII